jgi:hypothetical protein
VEPPLAPATRTLVSCAPATSSSTRRSARSSAKSSRPPVASAAKDKEPGRDGHGDQLGEDLGGAGGGDVLADQKVKPSGSHRRAEARRRGHLGGKGRLGLGPTTAGATLGYVVGHLGARSGRSNTCLDSAPVIVAEASPWHPPHTNDRFQMTPEALTNTSYIKAAIYN